MTEEVKKTKFKVQSFKNIEVENVEWLWEPYFPLGKLSFITGDPGVGKSYITILLASIISNGDRFPFTSNNTPVGNVIIQNGEDGVGDTIKKRLSLCEANDENIYMIELKKEHENDMDLLLSNISDLEILLDEIKPRLVIFDPITAFLGEVNMNNALDMRKTLKPIGKLAEKHNCAILFVIHRNKSLPGGNSLHRVLGSIDLSAIARSVVSIGLNKDKTETLFMHTKSNLSKKGKTLAFNIVDDKIKWLGTRGYVEDDEFLNMPTKEIPRNLAKQFILEYLLNYGNSKYEDILLDSKEVGISEKTLERARDNLKEEGKIDKEYIDGKNVYWFLKKVSPNLEV